MFESLNILANLGHTGDNQSIADTFDQIGIKGKLLFKDSTK